MDEHLLRFDKEKTLVFIDCETLNLCLNSCHNLPWQISMLKVKGDESVAEKDFYLKWDTNLKISEGAARITRYSQKTVDKKGVAPEEVNWDRANNERRAILSNERDRLFKDAKEQWYLLSKSPATRGLLKFPMPQDLVDQITQNRNEVNPELMN